MSDESSFLDNLKRTSKEKEPDAKLFIKADQSLKHAGQTILDNLLATQSEFKSDAEFALSQEAINALKTIIGEANSSIGTEEEISSIAQDDDYEKELEEKRGKESFLAWRLETEPKYEGALKTMLDTRDKLKAHEDKLDPENLQKYKECCAVIEEAQKGIQNTPEGAAARSRLYEKKITVEQFKSIVTEFYKRLHMLSRFAEPTETKEVKP